jgi:hypothetical protein
MKLDVADKTPNPDRVKYFPREKARSGEALRVELSIITQEHKAAGWSKATKALMKSSTRLICISGVSGSHDQVGITRLHVCAAPRAKRAVASENIRKTEWQGQ